MKIKGRIWKEDKFWLVEFPAIDGMTQGRTRKEALAMAQDYIVCLLDGYGMAKDRVAVEDEGDGILAASCANPANMVALVLRRMRAAAGLTARQAAAALGQKSPAAYNRYERGVSIPSILQMDKLLHVVGGRELMIA